MSAETIRKLIGEPATVNPISNEEVKAESWTYRRRIRTETTQEPVASTTLPAFIGMGMGDESGLGTVTVPAYRMKHTTFYQMTALLIVDGRLVEARQWVEQEVRYEG